MFVVGGGVVVDGRVATLAVVEDLDEVEHRGPEGLTGRPVIAVQQLTLEGGTEALGNGVVQCVADGAHRGDQAGLLPAAAEGQTGGLAAVVSVVS